MTEEQMTGLTDLELQDLLLKEFRLQDDVTVSDLLTLSWWPLHSSRGLWLRYLYVRLNIIDYLLFDYALKYDVKAGGDSLSRSQQFQHLKEMRDWAWKEIQRYDSGTGCIVIPISNLPDAYINRSALDADSDF